MHLVKWSTLCKSKKIRRPGNFFTKEKKNIALLAKWWWRNRSEANSLWSKILYYKFGDCNNARIKNSISALSPIINSILQVQECQNLKLFSSEDFRWQLDNDKTFKFFSDLCMDGELITITFSHLFDLCLYKDASVYQILVIWSLHKVNSLQLLRRSLRQWEKNKRQH